MGPLTREMIRLFLALPLAGFSETLQQVMNPLKETFLDLKWVEPSQAHVTLHFFGALPEEKICEIKNLVQPVAAMNVPLELKLDTLGFFPDRKKFRVMWMGLAGDTKKLAALQRRLCDVLVSSGFPIEKREFVPHATIARSRSTPVLFPTNAVLPSVASPLKRFDHLVLYKSSLTPQGPHYEALEIFPLSKSTPA